MAGQVKLLFGRWRRPAGVWHVPQSGVSQADSMCRTAGNAVLLVFSGTLRGYNSRMSRDTVAILKEALALPAEARAALADSLLDSLDVEVDADAEVAWQREIQRRVAELDSKAVSMLPWSEVRSRLMATLRNER